jgi:plasmid maintenance system antidote protein VapI
VKTNQPRTKGVRHAGGTAKPPTPTPGAVALKALLPKRGDQARAADALDITPSHLCDILRGAKAASGDLAFRIEDKYRIPARLFLRQKRAA